MRRRRTWLYLMFTLVIGLALPLQAGADAGGGSTVKKADPDLKQAERAIDAENWGEAVDYLNRVVARDESNADAHNLLGYAERKRGNLDAAFAHYQRALELDPKHRGAHEYIGEAYLMTGNLARAEEHLARLDKLCFFSCEEYRDLKEAIEDYRKQHPE